jgi:cytidine deaminase
MSQAVVVHRSSLVSPEFVPTFSGGANRAEVTAHPWTIENRLNLSDEELSRSCVLLDYARHQQYFASAPHLSNFKVGASVHCGYDRIAFGANAEYGAGANRAYDEGIHAEEAAVGSALNLYGRGSRIEMLALASDAANPSTACGKCRSLLETYASPHLVILSVGADGLATMWKLSELLPADLSSLDRFPAPSLQDAKLRALFEAAEQARGCGFIPFSEQVLGRSVAAIAVNGAVFSLPRVDSLAFYGTSSLRATISAACLSQAHKLEAVLLSSKSGLPTGEDRQLLFEYASLLGQAETLPVYLHREGSEGVIVTTPSALLPHGFGPKDLSISLLPPNTN